MRIFRRLAFIILTVLSVLFVGCKPHTTVDGINGPAREDSSPGATFFVYDGDGDGRVGDVVTSSKWPVPLTANFSFVACMKDRASAVIARGQRFEIENPENGQRIAPDSPSSEAGCITWQESIPFNYYAKQSAPLQIVRHVVGVGVHTGYFIVRYAIDPWAVGDNARDMIKPVQYLKKVSGPPNLITDRHAVAQRLSGEGDDGADLWISKLDFNVLDRQDFAGYSKIDFQIKLNPFVEWINNDGIPGFKKLDSGEFEVFAHLVATDTGPKQDQKVILTTSQMSTFATVKNGELLTTLSTNQERAVPIGNVVLVIRLVPRGFGGSRSLKSFEAIYELGDIHKMADAQLAQSCVDRLASCNFDKFLGGADNYKTLSESKYAFANDRFSFSSLKLRFVTVATTPAETATQRTVSYSVSTCVTDRRTGSRVSKMPFHVTYVDDKGAPVGASDPYQSQDLTTDDEGCLHWLAHIWHLYYSPEHFYEKFVHVTMGATDAGATLNFVLNPWDDKFTFGFDKRELSEDFIKSSDPKDKPPSRFFTGGYGYHTLRFLYSFDEYMSLQVRKTILLEVDPRVLRYSGIVNARKTTEGLRDGIYLMKVAIQKNYLDATTAGIKILGDPRDTNHVRSMIDPPSKDREVKNIRGRDYVTTATQLVRVVDGRLIKPVELTMVDLRLMRMRTNFLIELETVDEQLVSANEPFQEEYDREVKSDREAFRVGKENENLSEPQIQQKYDQRATDTQKKLKDAWDQLTEILAEKKKDAFKGVSLGDYNIPAELLEPIGKVLRINDFTKTKLPSCEDTDCERFVEKDSGLEPRTFVGPMIFLSNSYSDAVRPTDNLDEACHRPDNPFENGEGGENDWFGKRERDEQTTRRNKWYQYSKYYGSLRYLCDKSVDDLMVEEKAEKQRFKDTMSKYATLPAFVADSNSTFAIINPSNALEYTSSKNVLSMDDTTKLLNEKYDERVTYLGRAKQPVWSINDLMPLFFGTGDFNLEAEKKLSFNDVQALGLCNILTNRLSEQLRKFHPDERSNPFTRFYSAEFGRNSPFENGEDFGLRIFNRCVSRINKTPSAIFVDSRLRVLETGSDYTFKGGLQLNLNVGESFSVSASRSIGKSFDVVDVTTSVVGLAALVYSGGTVGTGVVGAVLIHLLRPLSLKGSDSLSDGDGTSIASQTYLVSQIAKFDVELTKYELCRTFRFDKSILNTGYYFDYPGVDPAFVDEMGRTFGQVLDRGITVCQGQSINKSIHVPEDYFYFTQHFTEGDMLDQADLINNPWLLQLRGDRDFTTFMNTIKAKEAVNPSNLGIGLGTDPVSRPLDWPLEHLAETYSQTAPSHPGFYTILPTIITQFPVNDQAINLHEDINGELCSNPVGGCMGMPIQSSPGNVTHAPDESPPGSSQQ